MKAYICYCLANLENPKFEIATVEVVKEPGLDVSMYKIITPYRNIAFDTQYLYSEDFDKEHTAITTLCSDSVYVKTYYTFDESKARQYIESKLLEYKNNIRRLAENLDLIEIKEINKFSKHNLDKRIIIFGSKDKDFNEYEIIDRFREWFIEMNNRRLTKKGKLFEFFATTAKLDSASIMFGNTHVTSGSGVGEDPYEHVAMVQKVKYLIVKCVELANQLALECNVEIEKHSLPAIPTTIRYLETSFNVIRK